MENLRQGNQLSVFLFQEYKLKVETAVDKYNRNHAALNEVTCSLLAAYIWRVGVLSEIWGTIASTLSKTGKNFLEDWRMGE